MSFLAGIGKYKTPGARELAELRSRVDEHARVEERVLNPSVEEGDASPDGWAAVGAGVIWVDEGYNSRKSLQLKAQNDTPEWQGQKFRVSPNQDTRFRARVKGTGSANVWLSVQWFTGADAWISEDVLAVDGNYADWAEVWKEVAAPGTAGLARLVFRVANADTVDIMGDEFSCRQYA